MSESGVLIAAQVYGLAQSYPGACPYCSGPHLAVFHGRPCPLVKAIEYHPNGTIKRVEFYQETAVSPEPTADAGVG